MTAFFDTPPTTRRGGCSFAGREPGVPRIVQCWGGDVRDRDDRQRQPRGCESVGQSGAGQGGGIYTLDFPIILTNSIVAFNQPD
jgi:hypothetical protein